jgi:NADH:ubiquinone oxidoreductase subunit C
MSTVEITPEMVGSSEPYIEDNGVYWYSYDGLSVRELAKAMNAVQARFLTITAYELPKNEGFRLEYHWDLAGRLLGFTFNLASNAIESIYDLCEAVDWIEREVHEGFGIEFTGRNCEPLLLRTGDAPGVNMREVPASTPAVHEEVAR